MGDGYDRFENEGNGGGTFVMGLLAGTVIGAGLGMLFAPKSGAELRNQIAEQADGIKRTATDTANEGYRRVTETANDWADRGKELYGKARDVVSKGADEAQRVSRDAATAVGQAADSAASAVRRG